MSEDKACDVLMVNAIGPGFTGESVRQEGIGGSELEVTQIAEALAARGHRVVVANGVAVAGEDHGVRYIPFLSCGGYGTRTLYVERGTTLHAIPEIRTDRIVIRATDIMCEHYEPHREWMGSGIATLIGVSEWQLEGFRRAVPGVQTLCIPPMLGPTPPTERVKGRFVFASAPCKGLAATIAKWRSMWEAYPEMRSAHLLLAMPGHAMGEAPPLSAYDQSCRIEYLGVPTIDEYRRLIASAEGLFYVNEMAETFCCAAAFAERSGTRPHILCRDGMGGIREGALSGRQGFLTTDERAFEADFLRNLGRAAVVPEGIVDRSPEALAPAWEVALGLVDGVPEMGDAYELRLPTTIHVDGDAPRARSPEAKMTSEPPLNEEPLGPYFGEFLSHLRGSLEVGGSELGLGMTLFSLAVSIRAAVCVEIGRFRGFSTLALAGAMRFNDVGWDEPKAAQQRPDVDYERLHAKKRRKVVSIDKFPEAQARERIERAGLSDFVHYVDQASEDVVLKGEMIDLLLIDGEHTEQAIKRDIARFVPWVRAGGYVVLHDYYGWYDHEGRNGSPIKKVSDELKKQRVEQLLIDTGYASLVLFRKTALEDVKAPTKVAPRADGKPTVGLVVLAKNENPIVARALGSCRSWIDAVTVVVDAESTDGTAELCERMGAEVHVRPYAGSLAETRNEALAIAEQRTDYMLVVDADDLIEGTRPEELTKDVYDLPIADHGIVYPRGQLIKSRTGARYVGCDRGCKMNIPHEYLDRPGATVGQCSSLVYKRLGGISGVSGWQDQAGAKAKYLRHARDLERHHVEHPEHARTVFYIAQSYRDAGEPAKAREWYRKRAALCADEEGWFSAFRVGELTQELGEDPTEAYLRAYEMRRIRAEPLVALAVYLRDEKRKRFELAYLYAQMAARLPLPPERLFLVPAIYQWVAQWELGLAAFYTARLEEAVSVWQRVLTVCPQEQRAQAHEILDACIKARDAAKRAA